MDGWMDWSFNTAQGHGFYIFTAQVVLIRQTDNIKIHILLVSLKTF